MAPTEGRVARPERRWGCRRGTSITAISWGTQELSEWRPWPPLRTATESTWYTPLPLRSPATPSPISHTV